jgi:predicted ATPase
MAELAHFKNFAKLKDTSVEFNDITVLAGKPGTGKSYVMKFQYALMETMSSIINGTYQMHYALMESSEQEQTLFYAIKNLVSLPESIEILIENNNFLEASKEFEAHYKLLSKKDTKNKEFLNIFKNSLDSFSKRQSNSLLASEEDKIHFIFRNILESNFGNITQIAEEFKYKNIFFDIDFKDNNLSIQKLSTLENVESSLFVETPLILEFEQFLPSERFKTPYHIDSLLEELNKNDFSFTSEETSSFINNFRNSTSKIIKGNITKGTQGFSFESESGKSFNIVNASSGIKSIGLLQYLVTNKALKKGSVLFWEEPEVHLHPDWQKKMVELFIELMNAGIKIVFSTHSAYMIEYLNALSKKQELTNRVSFNLLQEENGIVENTILSDSDNWELIQDELLNPLEEIAWEYL